MRRRRLTLGLLLLPTAGRLVAGRVAGAQSAVGRVVGIAGEVAVVRGAETLPLARDSALFIEDVIRTGAEGKVQIAFFAGLTVTVGPASETRVDRFAASRRSGLASAFRLVEGIIRLVGGAVSGPTAITVETPNAVAAVRSTDWLVQRTADASAVFVADGQVVVSAKTGGSVVLETGQGTDVRDGTRPTLPRSWGAERRRIALDLTTL